MHASEVITGETPIVPEITETEIVNTGTDIPLIDQTTGAIDTGTGVHESAPVDPIFGELGDL